MKQYAEYKDSGIEWIGEIPSEWGVLPVKRLATDKSSLFLDGDWIESDVIEESGIRYLTTGNIGRGFFKEQGGGYISEETFIKLKCLEILPDDLVISRLNEPLGRACLIPYTHDRYVIAVDNVVLRPNKGYHKKYILYCMNAQRYSEAALLVARGATMQRISRTILGNLLLPIPPFDTQKHISNYLDRKTAGIDALIADKQKLVELLQEKRATVISQAITKGLDKTAKMKDSGIEWIGEIPVEWEIKKLAFCADVQTGPFGSQLHSEDYVDQGTPIITVEHFGDGVILHKKLPLVSKSDTERLGKYSLSENDLVFSRVGSVDRCVIVKQEESGWLFSGRCLRVRFNKNVDISPEYINTFFSLKSFREYMLLVAVGATMPSINTTILNNIPIIVPTADEQDKIVCFLKDKIFKFDSLISNINEQIEKLKEYRQAVISEVVTGRVAV